MWRVCVWRYEQELMYHEACEIVKLRAQYDRSTGLMENAAQTSQDVFNGRFQVKSLGDRVWCLQQR